MAYAAYWIYSHPSQATPKHAAEVPTVKPAQFEKASAGSTMASKPGVVTTTGSGVAAGGSAAVGTTGKAKAETTPASQVKVAAKAPPAAAVTKPKELPKDTTKTATASTVKPEAPKVDPAKTSKPAPAAVATVAAKATESTKVQVEVPSTHVKSSQKAPAADDPFDALASSLPSSASVTWPEPKYTGPEVKEPGIKSEKGVRVGERDDTLPPGYRFKDMAPVPADTKPKDVPKPLSTDDALDSLSSGFTTSTAAPAPKKQEKRDHVESISAPSTAPSNFAAPPAAPGKKAETSAPPADKKAKMETTSDSVSLKAGVPTKTPAVAVCPAPPVDKKLKMDTGLDKKAQDTKPKTEMGDSMSLDALSALGDTLAAPEPKPESPKLRPEDIVPEDKVKKEKGVFVGEREDSIPPEYRFKKEELKKLPALKPEPSLDTAEALDILSGDFGSPSSAPLVQAPVVTSSAASTQKASVVKSPALPVDKKAQMEVAAGDFSLEAGLCPATAQKVESSALPRHSTEKKTDVKKPAAAKHTTDAKPKSTQGDSMSLDALSALGGTLAAPEPKPESPKLRPEDIVKEDTLKKEKGVFVGEREDSIPPEYRFKKEELKKLPAPKPEPSLDTAEALDFLSGDLSSPSFCLAPSSQAKVEDLSALDVLSGDFVAPKKTGGVQASAPPSTQTPEDDSMSLDALSALGGTLAGPEPKPESPKLRPEDIVKEDTLNREKGVIVGDTEGSIPPEYRFKKEQKTPSVLKPEPSLDTAEALDILSGEFSSLSSIPVLQDPAQTPADAALDALSGDFVGSAVAPTVRSSACPPIAAPCKWDQLDTVPDNAMDALSDTLKDIAPTPQPEPPLPKNIVKEKTVEEERINKMGERDDTLPPDYRPTAEDRKKMEEAKSKVPESPKEKPMDDKTALDLLSGDFSNAPTPPASSTTTTKAPVLDTAPLKPMPGPVLDSLSGTLLPDKPEFKSKTDKAKVLI